MTHATLISLAHKFIQSQGGRSWQTYPGKFLQGGKWLEAHSEGEPDQHAYRPITITGDMVGKVMLQFGKIEVKTIGDNLSTKRAKEQMTRLKYIVSQGGFAYLIRETKKGIEYVEVKE